MELKTLSTAELSRTSPARLVLQVLPCSLSKPWKCPLVYRADSTGRRKTGLPRLAGATAQPAPSEGLVTMPAVIDLAMLLAIRAAQRGWNLAASWLLTRAPATPRP